MKPSSDAATSQNEAEKIKNKAGTLVEASSSSTATRLGALEEDAELEAVAIVGAAGFSGRY